MKNRRMFFLLLVVVVLATGCVPYASVGGGQEPIVIPGNPGGEFVTIRNDWPGTTARCDVRGLVHRHDILHRGESFAAGETKTFFFVGKYYGEYRRSERRDVTILCDLFSGEKKVGWWQERFSVYARLGDYRNREEVITAPRSRGGGW